MTIQEDMNSLKQTARATGLLILITVVLAPFSMLYVPSTLIVPGDATTTAKNIVASESLFRLAITSDAIIFLIEIVLCALVYVLIKPVSKTLALVAVFARLAMTVMQGVNLLNHFLVLLLLSGAGYLTGFEPDQLHALVSLSLSAHEYGVLIWGLFFGLHLLVLGYLVYRSGFMPRFVGVVLVFVAVFYFTQSFGNVLLPQYKAIFTVIGSLAFLELVFPLWLLVKGVAEQSKAQS